MKYILVILIILIYPFNINAKPITIFGLNWDMNLITAVTEKGYNCQNTADLWGNSYVGCQDANKEIVILDKEITFNCSVFNGCGFTLQEIAQSIVDQGVIYALDYEPEMVYDLDMNPYYIERYCGRGQEGDILCIIEDMNLFGQPIISIKLEKGNYGKGGMSFQ